MSWPPAEVTTALVTVLASLGTLALSQWHQRSMAEKDRALAEAEARESRLFQAREARYADRRAAIIEFIAAASDETDSILDFERNSGDQLSPGDVHDDYTFKKLNAAYARMVVVASPDVVEAATALRAAVFDTFWGAKGAWPAYGQALGRFQEIARAMLAEDRYAD